MRMHDRQAVVALLPLLLLVGLLGGCGASGGPSAGQVSPIATATATPRSYPAWQTYTDPKFGFRLDVPGILAPQGNSQPDPYTSSNGWYYNLSQGTPPADLAATAELQVGMMATTKMPTSCTKGQAATVGRNIPAYGYDNLSPTYTPSPNGPAGGNLPGIGVMFVSGGVLINVSIGAPPPKETFHSRYDAIWQHMLASFVPGPAVSNPSFTSLQDLHCS